MKVALLTPYLVGKAGGERLALDLAHHLQKLGDQVEIFCYAANYDTCYPEMMKKVKINSVVSSRGSAHSAIHSHKTFLNKFFRFTRPYYELYMMRKLAKIIPHGFDVILCMNQPSEWAAYLAKRRLKIPAVWICNEPPFYHDARISKDPLFTLSGLPVYKLWDVRAARSMDKMIALSKLYKKYIDSTYKANSEVVYAGVNMEHTAHAFDIRKKYGLKNEFIALFVGSFTDYKRPMDAIAATAMADHSVLFMIGEGGDEEKYRALVEEEKLGRKVFFISRLSEPELESFYNQCDCVIFTAEQSWGLVIPEAMLHGKPVITCPETGASEIVKDGKTGFIVPARSPHKITEKMKLLQHNHALARSIGANAKKWAEENLTMEDYARRIQSILSLLVPPR